MYISAGYAWDDLRLTWYSNILDWFWLASVSCKKSDIRSMISSSLRKWTSLLVG